MRQFRADNNNADPWANVSNPPTSETNTSTPVRDSWDVPGQGVCRQPEGQPEPKSSAPDGASEVATRMNPTESKAGAAAEKSGFQETAGTVKDAANFWEEHGAVGGVTMAGKELGDAAERVYDDASRSVNGAVDSAGKAINGAVDGAGKAVDGAFREGAGVVKDSARFWEEHGAVGGVTMAGKELGDAAGRVYGDASRAVTGAIDDASRSMNRAAEDANRSMNRTIADAGRSLDAAGDAVAAAPGQAWEASGRAFKGGASTVADSASYWEKHGLVGGLKEAWAAW